MPHGRNTTDKSRHPRGTQKTETEQDIQQHRSSAGGLAVARNPNPTLHISSDDEEEKPFDEAAELLKKMHSCMEKPSRRRKTGEPPTTKSTTTTDTAGAAANEEAEPPAFSPDTLIKVCEELLRKYPKVAEANDAIFPIWRIYYDAIKKSQKEFYSNATEPGRKLVLHQQWEDTIKRAQVHLARLHEQIAGLAGASYGKRLLYKLNVYRGDLERYKGEAENATTNSTFAAQNPSRGLNYKAFIKYANAAQILPMNGLAYNQMGVAMEECEEWMQCLYYYLRAARAPGKPNKKSWENVKRIFQRFHVPAALSSEDGHQDFQKNYDNFSIFFVQMCTTILLETEADPDEVGHHESIRKLAHLFFCCARHSLTAPQDMFFTRPILIVMMLAENCATQPASLEICRNILFSMICSCITFAFFPESTEVNSAGQLRGATQLQGPPFESAQRGGSLQTESIISSSGTEFEVRRSECVGAALAAFECMLKLKDRSATESSNQDQPPPPPFAASSSNEEKEQQTLFAASWVRLMSNIHPQVFTSSPSDNDVIPVPSLERWEEDAIWLELTRAWWTQQVSEKREDSCLSKDDYLPKEKEELKLTALPEDIEMAGMFLDWNCEENVYQTARDPIRLRGTTQEVDLVRCQRLSIVAQEVHRTGRKEGTVGRSFHVGGTVQIETRSRQKEERPLEKEKKEDENFSEDDDEIVLFNCSKDDK